MANADFWRTLSDELRRLADDEHRVVPDPADSRRLSVYGDYTGEQSTGTGRWRVGHGFSADFRTSFEEVATRGGSALKPPRGVKPLPWWLHSLATFLAVHELPYETGGFLGVWDPHRVAIVRDAVAASAFYCSHLAKECASDEAESSRSGDEQSATPGKQRREVSRRATCDLDVEEVRRRATQMRAEGASHHEICRRLGNAERPARTAWKHLPWDKAYMETRSTTAFCQKKSTKRA
jgi:hypothetical protein